jgi:hypothetical protein
VECGEKLSGREPEAFAPRAGESPLAIPTMRVGPGLNPACTGSSPPAAKKFPEILRPCVYCAESSSIAVNGTSKSKVFQEGHLRSGVGCCLGWKHGAGIDPLRPASNGPLRYSSSFGRTLRDIYAWRHFYGPFDVEIVASPAQTTLANHGARSVCRFRRVDAGTGVYGMEIVLNQSTIG